MYLVHVCIGALLSLHNHVADAFNLPEQSHSATPAPLLHSASPLNHSDTRIQCESTDDLMLNSCLDVFRNLDHSGDFFPIRVGNRGTGTYAYNLPWRRISNDGRCAFDIVKRGSAPYEETTPIEIARAALKLMNDCLRDKGRRGGIISGIGRSGSLSIVIRKFNPEGLSCHGNSDQRYGPDKCDILLSNIPADAGPRHWGPVGSVDVDRIIPAAFPPDPSHGCQIVVSNANPRHPAVDTLSYYDMWQAAVAMKGVCARFGKSGKYRALGTNRLLLMQMTDGRPRLREGGAVVVANGTIGNSS